MRMVIEERWGAGAGGGGGKGREAEPDRETGETSEERRET